jgi:hypothetical protein
MSSSNPLTNVADSNTETLNYIQELQTIEQGIFTNLEQNGASMTAAEQNQLINQMNDISQMRINLYQSLSGMNTLFQNALVNSRDTLDEQVVAIQIVENQLNEAKSRLRSLEDEKNNNVRNIQINDYYAERYGQHAQLMRTIIFMLIPIIILAILYNKGILPKPIYLILVVIVALIGFYFTWNIFFSMMRRSNMNYQEYDWGFDANTAPTSSTTTVPVDPWANGSSSSVCVGAQCCNQYEMFDASLNQCVLLPSSSTTTSNNSTSGTNLNSIFSNDISNIDSGLNSGVNSLTSGVYNAFASL